MATGVGEFEHVLLIGTDGVPYSASGGVTVTDSGQFVPTTDSASPVMGLYELAPTTLANNDVGVVAVTANRVLKAALSAADGSAITTLPVSLASVPSHAVTNAGTFAVQAAGDVAHDTADSGAPVKIGGYASSTIPTSVTAGDRANLWLNLGGAVVLSGSPTEVSADAQSLGVATMQRIGNTGGGPLAVLPLMHNGATLDRLKGSATDGLTVNLGANNDVTVTSGTVTTVTTLTGGGIAHDSADSGNPHKIGMKAIDIGTQPTAVTANDRTDWYANRNGVPWMLGGSPAIVTKQLNVTDADGAQTDVALVTVSAGTAIVVTAFQAMCDGANTVDVAYRVGFGTANTPAADAAGIISSHPGVKAGSGVVVGNGGGVIGMGASNEDLRVTCEDPVTGAIDFIITYFTVLIG